MNVMTGIDSMIAASSGNTDNSVASNGYVAYWANSNYNVRWFQNGTTINVTNDGGSPMNIYPVTDGINVVFQKKVSAAGSSGEIWMFDGSQLTLLAPTSSGTKPYLANNGWVAFTKADNGGLFQVWTRSPTGTLRAVSSLGASSSLNALGSDGSVVFQSGSDRYHATTAGAPAKISTALGTVVWRDSAFITLLGNSAFTIVP